jgi:hypothetical protein
LKRLASRVLCVTGIAFLGAIGGLLAAAPVVQAGQGGGQAQPAGDNTTLWLVGGLVVVMVVAGIGLFFTRRGK